MASSAKDIQLLELKDTITGLKTMISEQTELIRYPYDYWVAFQDYAFQNAQFAKNFNRRRPSMDH